MNQAIYAWSYYTKCDFLIYKYNKIEVNLNHSVLRHDVAKGLLSNKSIESVNEITESMQD